MSDFIPANHNPLEILQTVFGYDSFRPEQEAIVQHVASGQDAMVLMPTGGGKSLCFQVPGLARGGVTIVVSPLIALMEDQVQNLREAGVGAAFLNSSLNQEDFQHTLKQAYNGELNFLYMAPERLINERSLQMLQRLPIALFAIDEAHCVSQWGHEFRPEYAQLSQLREWFPQVPLVALTATADEVTRNDIANSLGLNNAKWFVSSFDRPNIQYRIAGKQQPKQQLLRFIQQEHPDDAGIVYCMSRKRVDETAEWLRDEGVNAVAYHAGMSTALRSKVLKKFMHEEGVVVVATIAFGMGIDKPNVRFVAHLDLPKSIEAYYQETGRAGRDGLGSTAWMVYGLQDVIFLRQMMQGGEGALSFKRVEQTKLDAMLGLCEVTRCRRQTILGYFGESLNKPCGNCDNCNQPPETWDATVAAQKALSCVYRTGQRFGVAHLIDVLLGKQSERIDQLGHNKTTTYGIGNELNANGWRSVYRQLIAHGILTAKHESMGALVLTERARPVLKGETTLMLRREERKAKLREKTKHQRTVSSSDEKLWNALREKRTELAKEASVPPYVIFHDATLMLMMELKPRTRVELSNISGVGERKLEKYGAAFLAVIKGVQTSSEHV